MRKSAIRVLTVFAAVLLLLSGQAQAQAEKPVPYQEGLHYFELDQAPVGASDKIVLSEAFSYLCTHCNTFEPYVNSWLKRKPEHVEFERIPVIFGRSSWELYARAYVTANMMGVPDEAHSALMDRLWKEKKILRSMDELAAFYSQYGIEQDKFLSTSRSFAVDGKLRKDQILVQTYGITGTPALVLSGKYRISANSAVPSFEVMLDVVDYLIEVETKKMQQKAAATEVAAADSNPGGQ